MGKMIAREHLAQALHGLGVAVEIRKGHTSQSARIYHERVAGLSLEGLTLCAQALKLKMFSAYCWIMAGRVVILREES